MLGTIRYFLILFMGLAGVFVFSIHIQTEARAQSQSCDIALVLAIDASSSVDDQEYRLQMEGTASALMNPNVLDAIVSLNGVYLAGFEWNGETNQSLLFDWSYLRSEADVAAVAQQIVTHVRNNRKAPTALGSALTYAHGLLGNLPTTCWRNVIDVSGDGVSNHGIVPAAVYRIFDFSQITVNGLAIINPKRRNTSFYSALDEYYAAELLHGPAAFVIVAEGFEDFARAMKEKLLKELTPTQIGMLEGDHVKPKASVE
ncbi:MAG: DUF1194 domain-containing protein [Pseudomonadota bacterium]